MSNELENERVHSDTGLLWVESLRSILRTDFPIAEPLADGLLYSGDQVLLYGKAGSGKSYISMKLMSHLAMGKDFGYFEIKEPKKILYVDGEMSGEAIKKRFTAMRQPNEDIEGWSMCEDNLRYISRFMCPEDMQDFALTMLNDESNMQRLMNTIIAYDTQILVLDNVFTLFSFEDFSSPVEWLIHVNPLLNFCRKRNIAVWLIDHANKGDKLFGTMSKTVTLDLLIKVDNVNAKETWIDQETTDFSFTFNFEKARRLSREQQAPITFDLQFGDVTVKEDEKRKKIFHAKKYYQETDLSFREIAEKLMQEHELASSHTAISNWQKKFDWKKK